jgi:hypothetical protein
MYQFYPHERVLQDLDISLSVLAPLFINCYSVDGAVRGVLPSHSENGSGHFDIKCTMVEHSDGVIVTTDYNKELYTAEQIEGDFRFYLRLLERILSHDAEPLSAILNF